MGTVRNRKQDREKPQVTNKNKLARLGTVPNRKPRRKISKKYRTTRSKKLKAPSWVIEDALKGTVLNSEKK